MARSLDVKGKPGPHNWLEYIVPEFWAGREGGYTFIMVPEMAKHLLDMGLSPKKRSTSGCGRRASCPSEIRNFSWPDFSTNGWIGIEPTSGKHWKELPDDYMVPGWRF